MAGKLQFNLVSPERELISSSVDEVIIPASEGWIGVLANHAPMMTTLAPGALSVNDGGAVRKVFVRGGFAEITPAGLTVLAERAYPLEELDSETLKGLVAEAEAELESASDDAARQLAQLAIERLKEVQAAA